MFTSQCCRPVEPPQAKSRHRVRNLAVMLVLCGGLSLILYNHGSAWWYAPLAVLAVVLTHIAILGGIIFAATRFTSTRRAPDGTACCREGAGHTHKDQGLLIRRPRLYDWLVRVITLGREGKLRQWTLDMADLQPGNKLLDVGCGTGTLLLAAAERVGPSGALHGIEPAAEMAGHARHKVKAGRIPMEIVEGSAACLPYSPASFDAVFCTMVLHHLPGQMRRTAIREMRRVLRPGGRVVIADLQRPRSRARALRAALSLVSILHSLESNTSQPDMLDIEPLLTELGFEDITRSSFGSGAIGAIVGRLGSDASVSTQDA